jgi:hypothetical protein
LGLLAGLIMLFLPSLRPKTCLLFIATGFFLWMTTVSSSWVWQVTPFMSQGQFPWRLLNFLFVPLALLVAGPCVSIGKNHFPIEKWWVFLVFIVFVFSMKIYGTPAGWYPASTWDLVRQGGVITAKTSDHNEYFPIWRPDETGARPEPGTVTVWRAEMRNRQDGARYRRVQVTCLNETAELRVAWNYYPTWKACEMESGRSLVVHPDDQGLIRVGPLPVGTHWIEVSWGTTPAQRVGRWVSGAAVLLLVWIAVRSRKGKAGGEGVKSVQQADG